MHLIEAIIWPFHLKNMHFSQLVKHQFLAFIIIIIITTKVCYCFQFNFPTFQPQDGDQLILSKNSVIALDAIQVTPDVRGQTIENFSGRAFYNKPYRIWSKKNNQIASFTTTFVLNVKPETFPNGEGIAFILTSDTNLPENSSGEWLGIVNATINGTSSSSSSQGIVAVEFDTRKSFPEDGPDNHVGININSINSIKQVPLINTRVNISSGSNVTVKIQYDNDVITVFGSMPGTPEESMETLLVSPPLNLSSYLPEEVYVGFSASTSNFTELNCVRAWKFDGVDIVHDKNKLLWVWITVPVVAIVVGGVVFFVLRQRKRRLEKLEDAYPGIEDQIQHSSMAPKKFRLREIRRATGGFSPQNKLGEGGFGTVYKGLIGGKEIAVKRVSKNSRQGKQEFIAEVTTIGSLHHRNLVKLIGWCYENRELLIVYEYMPNGSLDKYLFGDKKIGNGFQGGSNSTLNWKTRHSVIYGVAQALDYLHNGCEKRVLHRDIKASNIMLDHEFNAKLGDFGLARTLQKRNETHHSTKEIAGTPGYMAPETFLTGRATVETDVYAFGVLVLEVACGKRPGNMYANDDYKNSIVYWVWELYGKGKIVSALDSRISKEEEDEDEEVVIIKEEDVCGVLVLGLACCHPNPHLRPSMRTVLQVLNGEAPPPVVPVERPAFVWPAMPPSFKEDVDRSLINESVTPIFTEVTGR